MPGGIQFGGDGDQVGSDGNRGEGGRGEGGGDGKPEDTSGSFGSQQ